MIDHTTIIALHGAGMNRTVWDALDLELPEYDVEAPDFPGHAEGGAPANLLPSIPAMSAWLANRLQGHAPQSVVLLGHSMGALVALEATKYSCIKSVILLGAATSMPVNETLLKLSSEQPQEAARMMAKWSVFSGAPNAESARQAMLSVMQATPPAAIGADLKACNDYHGGEGAAKSVRKPALILSGAADKMARAEDGQALAALIPGSSYAALDHCGHMMMLEQPAQTALKIKQFLPSSPR